MADEWARYSLMLMIWMQGGDQGHRPSQNRNKLIGSIVMQSDDREGGFLEEVGSHGPLIDMRWGQQAFIPGKLTA